jgi:phospholipase/carboxylesterase
MRQDTEQSLRTALCLTNPTGMQAGRWGGCGNCKMVST